MKQIETVWNWFHQDHGFFPFISCFKMLVPITFRCSVRVPSSYGQSQLHLLLIFQFCLRAKSFAIWQTSKQVAVDMQGEIRPSLQSVWFFEQMADFAHLGMLDLMPSEHPPRSFVWTRLSPGASLDLSGYSRVVTSSCWHLWPAVHVGIRPWGHLTMSKSSPSESKIELRMLNEFRCLRTTGSGRLLLWTNVLHCCSILKSDPVCIWPIS